MSDDTPKLFAEVVRDRRDEHHTVVCRGRTVFHSKIGPMCDDVAAAINEAYAEALQLARGRVKQLLEVQQRGLLGLSADRLAEEEKKVKQLQAALDVRDDPTRAQREDLIREYLEDHGLTRRKPEEWSDEELTRRQREADREWRRRTNAFAKKHAGDAHKQHLRAHQELVEQVRRDLMNRFATALRAAEIPETQEIFAMLVDETRAVYELQPDLAPDVLVPLVVERLSERLRDVTSETAPLPSPRPRRSSRAPKR